MPSSEWGHVVADYAGLVLVVEDEVRVGMREVANRLDEVAVVLAGGEVGCEEDLAGSINELIRDNKGEFLDGLTG
jgi:hypothetical protein